jgi:hypothetical protein
MDFQIPAELNNKTYREQLCITASAHSTC